MIIILFICVIILFLLLQEIDEAIQLADTALTIKSDSYEAYYARARANREAKYVCDNLCLSQSAIVNIF